jgi:hypothetical protein
MVFGVVFGAAAALNVDANPLQSGGDTDLTCDDEIQVHWNIQWSNNDGDYVIHEVNIGGVNEACNESTVVVTLTDSNGNHAGQKTTTKTSGNDPMVDFLGVPKVSEIHDVHVAIIN